MFPQSDWTSNKIFVKTWKEKSVGIKEICLYLTYNNKTNNNNKISKQSNVQIHTDDDTACDRLISHKIV